MDHWLWGQGYNLWITSPTCRESRYPHELDFLRGFHNRHALGHLASWLKLRTNKPVRLQCVWEDKNAYVQIEARAGQPAPPVRELADLAVIVQRVDTTGELQRFMWLLQAKVCLSPDARLKGKSSAREIELLESLPKFALLDRDRRTPVSRIFDPSKFGTPISRFWSFLTFHRDPDCPHEGPFGPYPVTQRWPGSNINSTQNESLCHALADMVLRPGVRFGGRVLDRKTNRIRKDEWSDLFYDLMHHADKWPSLGHARSPSNLEGSVLTSAARMIDWFTFHSLVFGTQSVLSSSFSFPWDSKPFDALERHLIREALHEDIDDESLSDERMKTDVSLSRNDSEAPPNDGEPPHDNRGDSPGDGAAGVGHVLFIDVG
jgi:hypothetical protein